MLVFSDGCQIAPTLGANWGKLSDVRACPGYPGSPGNDRPAGALG